jgi:hypothetical protein
VRVARKHGWERTHNDRIDTFVIGCRFTPRRRRDNSREIRTKRNVLGRSEKNFMVVRCNDGMAAILSLIISNIYDDDVEQSLEVLFLYLYR